MAGPLLLFLMPISGLAIEKTGQPGEDEFTLSGITGYQRDASSDREKTGQGTHYGFTGTISKIRSGMLFVKTDNNLRLRTISPLKADRVGLHNAKVGEGVNIIVDSGNVLMDVAKTDQFFPEHRFVSGTLRYVDPYWAEIQISTPEGFERIDVDTLAGSKLSVFQEGEEVTLTLDTANVMVDISRGRR
jgi:translation elongation factor P/translation initiation factor 5A